MMRTTLHRAKFKSKWPFTWFPDVRLTPQDFHLAMQESAVFGDICPICGDHPTIKELIDYDPFCGIPGEIGRAISRGKPTRTRRSGSAAGQQSHRADSNIRFQARHHTQHEPVEQRCGKRHVTVRQAVDQAFPPSG
jgi:hypothetical protein